VPCKFFKNGACTAGKNCVFSHSKDVEPENLICKYYTKGNCKFGNKCALSHGLADKNKSSNTPNSNRKQSTRNNISGQNIPRPPMSDPSSQFLKDQSALEAEIESKLSMFKLDDTNLPMSQTTFSGYPSFTTSSFTNSIPARPSLYPSLAPLKKSSFSEAPHMTSQPSFSMFANSLNSPNFGLPNLERSNFISRPLAPIHSGNVSRSTNQYVNFLSDDEESHLSYLQPNPSHFRMNPHSNFGLHSHQQLGGNHSSGNFNSFQQQAETSGILPSSLDELLTPRELSLRNTSNPTSSPQAFSNSRLQSHFPWNNHGFPDSSGPTPISLRSAQNAVDGSSVLGSSLPAGSSLGISNHHRDDSSLPNGLQIHNDRIRQNHGLDADHDPLHTTSSTTDDEDEVNTFQMEGEDNYWSIMSPSQTGIPHTAI
jgi:hypothetical protein